MSRASVVTMLIAAEVLIVGMAIYAVGHGRASWAAGLHHVDFTAAPIAPVAAGSAPRVVIDDAASRVHVGVSPDELVHVSDLTQMRGAVYSTGSYPHLRVTRTSDGVRVERPGGGRLSIEVFGFSKQAIEVDVPRDSHIEIADCAGADVAGITGGASVHSNDGHVTLADMQGSIDARSDDGYLSATNVRGDHLGIVSSDGHLTLKNVAVGSLLAQTRDGRIEAEALSVTGDATLQTDDGAIALKLAPNADLTIDASTRDGRIVVDGNSLDRDDAAQRTIRLGAATGKMKVATSDGSIHILTNGDSLQ
jgi:hypothetical protein